MMINEFLLLSLFKIVCFLIHCNFYVLICFMYSIKTLKSAI